MRTDRQADRHSDCNTLHLLVGKVTIDQQYSLISEMKTQQYKLMHSIHTNLAVIWVST